MTEVKLLEELVSSTPNGARHFTFETKDTDVRWQVMLGDLGILVCAHKPGELNKLFIAEPNFVELYREFEALKVILLTNGLSTTEPVLCWIRGLLHAFMAENPNPVNCSVVMTGMSSTRR